MAAETLRQYCVYRFMHFLLIIAEKFTVISYF
jgi:hypothetical protein